MRCTWSAPSVPAAAPRLRPSARRALPRLEDLPIRSLQVEPKDPRGEVAHELDWAGTDSELIAIRPSQNRGPREVVGITPDGSVRITLDAREGGTYFNIAGVPGTRLLVVDIAPERLPVARSVGATGRAPVHLRRRALRLNRATASRNSDCARPPSRLNAPAHQVDHRVNCGSSRAMKPERSPAGGRCTKRSRSWSFGGSMSWNTSNALTAFSAA